MSRPIAFHFGLSSQTGLVGEYGRATKRLSGKANKISAFISIWSIHPTQQKFSWIFKAFYTQTVNGKGWRIAFKIVAARACPGAWRPSIRRSPLLLNPEMNPPNKLGVPAVKASKFKIVSTMPWRSEQAVLMLASNSTILALAASKSVLRVFRRIPASMKPRPAATAPPMPNVVNASA